MVCMANAHVTVLPIGCNLSLLIHSHQFESESSGGAIEPDQPFSLSARVEIHGAGAIALVALAPTITAEFYAKAIGPGEDVAIGQADVQATVGTYVYHPTLAVQSPSSTGLHTSRIYRLGVLVRIGAPALPSLIHGYIEPLTLEVYQIPSSASDPAISETQITSATKNHHAKKRLSSSNKPV